MWPKKQYAVLSTKGGESFAASRLKTAIASFKSATCSRKSDEIAARRLDLTVLLDAILKTKYTSPVLVDDVATAASLLNNKDLFFELSTLPKFVQVSVSAWVEAVKSFGSSVLNDVSVIFCIQKLRQ